jgi:hypothetical protein
MICRLYGEETNTHFRMEWFLMAYTVAKTRKSFNWDNILSFNITNQVWEAQGMKNHGFYMTTYLIDAICVAHRFPTFKWAWSPDQIPIHVYFSQLWEENYKEHIYDICDYFLAPLHKSIFRFHPHIGIPGAIKSLKEIGDWYMKKYYTYVRIFGAIGPPHFLPKYVPDKFLAREIAYQTVEKGAIAYLSEEK